jgi:electron transport complex protein RnfG
MDAAGNIAVAKDGGNVQAVTASTITSRAVSAAVRAAANAAVEWLAFNGGN